MVNPGNRTANMVEQVAGQLDWFSVHHWRSDALADTDVALFFSFQVHMAD